MTSKAKEAETITTTAWRERLKKLRQTIFYCAMTDDDDENEDVN